MNNAINNKYKFLQKDNVVVSLKYGFSYTSLIIGGFLLILRRQFIIGSIYTFIDYFLIWLIVGNDISNINFQKEVLMIIWVAVRVLFAQNANYWWYSSLIKKGFKEIKSPFEDLDLGI